MFILRTLDMLVLNQNYSGVFAEQITPWLIDIDVFGKSIENTGWDVLSINSSNILNAKKENSNNQNASVSFDVVLSAGTWNFEMHYLKFNNSGIYTVQIDGVSIGTIDGYSGTTTYNQMDNLQFTVSTTGKKILKLIISGKNASSSGYYGSINHIQLKRIS